MLRLYNTLSRKLEDFVSWQKKQVSLYSCGPTVYAPPHLGNMRYFIFVDTLRRVLEFNKYSTKHVMNITDVGHLTSDEDTGDDKMELAAQKEHKTAAEIAAEITALFIKDLKALNIGVPAIMPRATQTINWQIDLIKHLEQKEYTYRTSDGIYFDTATFPSYGRLSGQKAESKKAGARVAMSSEKKQPTDFALWKFSKPEDKRQMEWPSPWGTGFPGWHIECSAMAMHELGEQIDLHTGGIDHIAVHHENEIAQSEAATGKYPFVKYWLHGEFLVMPGKRMGKSEGNSITLQDVVDQGIHPLAFRYLCIQTHYRSKLDFSWEALRGANIGLQRIWAQIDQSPDDPEVGCAEFEQKFEDAVNDDLNTPQGLSIMQSMLKSEYPWSAKLQSLLKFDSVFGLGLFKNAPDRPKAGSSGWIINPLIQKEEDPTLKLLVEERELARNQKDWHRADEIRKKIERLGYTVLDTQEGPRLKIL